jgi:transcriptional regulator with XRE-family HTH domain
MSQNDAYAIERAGLLLALGAKLRAERERRGLSQEGLAALANIHRTHVGALELGRRDPHASMLLILADSLGVPAGVLLDGLPVPLKRKPATHSTTAP